jgi:hypothetical protein
VGWLALGADLRGQYDVRLSPGNGEVVVLRPDGVSDFDALSLRKHDKRAQLYVFDMLVVDEDLRSWPVALPKGALAGLLSDPVDGISSQSTSKARSVMCCSASPVCTGRRNSHDRALLDDALKPHVAFGRGEEPRVQQGKRFPSITPFPQIRVVSRFADSRSHFPPVRSRPTSVPR